MVAITRSQSVKRRKCIREQRVNIARSRSPESESVELESDLELESELVPKPCKCKCIDELIEGLPRWYIKIHERFPHLALEKADALMKRIRAAPGYTITVHSGDYTCIERPKGGGHKQSEMAWSCCHGIIKGYASYCPPGTCTRDGVLTATPWGMPTCQESPDRKNPDPCGKCDKSTTFSLEASDFTSRGRG